MQASILLKKPHNKKTPSLFILDSHSFLILAIKSVFSSQAMLNAIWPRSRIQNSEGQSHLLYNSNAFLAVFLHQTTSHAVLWKAFPHIHTHELC